MTGAFGLVSLAIFREVGDIAAGLSLPATAAASLALVVVPTLLMGATLPLLVGHLARRSRHIGGAVGLFYYVNTLGAATACFLCAFLLFPFLGMSGSIYVPAAMNGAVALGALAEHLYGGAELTASDETIDARPARDGERGQRVVGNIAVAFTVIGDRLPIDAEDREEFIVEGLRLALLVMRGFVPLRKGRSLRANFVPVNGHAPPSRPVLATRSHLARNHFPTGGPLR